MTSFEETFEVAGGVHVVSGIPLRGTTVNINLLKVTKGSQMCFSNVSPFIFCVKLSKILQENIKTSLEKK